MAAELWGRRVCLPCVHYWQDVGVKCRGKLLQQHLLWDFCLCLCASTLVHPKRSLSDMYFCLKWLKKKKGWDNLQLTSLANKLQLEVSYFYMAGFSRGCGCVAVEVPKLFIYPRAGLDNRWQNKQYVNIILCFSVLIKHTSAMHDLILLMTTFIF